MPVVAAKILQSMTRLTPVNKKTAIVIRSCEMRALFELVKLNQGERAVIGSDASLSAPLPAAQNLLNDSGFSLSFTDSWEVYNIEPIEGITTTVEVVGFESRDVLVLRSQGHPSSKTSTP